MIHDSLLCQFGEPTTSCSMGELIEPGVQVSGSKSVPSRMVSGSVNVQMVSSHPVPCRRPRGRCFSSGFSLAKKGGGAGPGFYVLQMGILSCKAKGWGRESAIAI